MKSHTFLVLPFFLWTAGLAQVCAPLAGVAPNSVTTSTIDGTCTLPDATGYTEYLLNFPRRGTWSASVTPADGATPFALILRDSSGARIDSGAVIQRPVERGLYHLRVSVPQPGQGGAFTLNSNFTGTPDILCQNFAPLGTTRPLNGSLGPGSCALPDGSVFDGYQLTLYGTGTVDIAVAASAFTPLLILRTSDGHALTGTTSTDASGATHLTVPEAGSDTFTLVVAVSSPDQPGGPYSLSATFTPDADETCLSTVTLTAPQQYSGTIANAPCTFNLPGVNSSALFNYFNVHLDQAGVFQSSIDASDFSSQLLLLDADGSPIAQDVDSGGSGSPVIRRQLAPGDYRLVLFNQDSFGGAYTLNYQFTPGTAACPVNSLAPGDQATGTLAGASSCRNVGYLADVYQIVLPADGTVNLSLTSPDFSTYLDLHDSGDNDLTWSKQDADSASSSITADFQAGTYYVYAASADLPGGYALSYTFTPKTLGPCPPPVPLPFQNGYIHNALLGSTGCQGVTGRPADYYAFTLPSASTEAIFMLSGDVIPDLTLYRSDGTPLRHDQNSYAAGNAMIVQYLPAGDYLVRGRSAVPSATGLYDIDLLFSPAAPPQLCSPLVLPLSSPVSGQTSFTSCLWFDKTFADVYQLNVADSTELVTISAQSSDFDPYLILLDAKGNVLATDDNSGGGTSSQLVQMLDPGSYSVVVKPADDPTSAGSYLLTAVPSAVAADSVPRRIFQK